MKELQIEDAFNLLRVCDGILLEGRLVEPILVGLEGEDDNEFFYLSWSEEIRGEWVDFHIAFREGDNQIVLCEGSTMTLINTDGEEEPMTLLREWNVETDSFES